MSVPPPPPGESASQPIFPTPITPIPTSPTSHHSATSAMDETTVGDYFALLDVRQRRALQDSITHTITSSVAAGISVLKEDIQKLQEDNATLREEVGELRGEMAQLKSGVVEMRKEEVEVGEKVDALTRRKDKGFLLRIVEIPPRKKSALGN